MPRTPLVAGALSILLVLSVLAVGGTASGNQSTKELTECTTITEPGVYELTEDLEYGIEDHCIEVEADDVTIDGNGYSFNNTESDDSTSPMGHAIVVQEQHNVTVRDVTFTETASVHVDDSTAITVENSVFHDDLRVKYSEDVTIRDNHFAADWVEVDISHSDEVHIENNRIDGDVEVETRAETANVTARDNYGDGQLDVTVSAGEAVIENNTLPNIGVTGGEGTRVEVARNHGGSDRLGVAANGVARVHNNTIDGGTLTLGGLSDDFIVTHNTVTNADIGVYISGGYDAGADILLKHNRITNNEIGIKTYSNLPDIHQNDLSGNTEYGILYTQDFGVVNATHNYWGDRPSSTDDEDAPFEDPETGTLADGTGTAVSEATRSADDAPGISNIHFDPWLDSAPAAGVVDEESDSDDSDEETTTTTTTTTTEETTTTTTTEDTTTTTPATTTTPTTATTTTTKDTTTTTTATTTTQDKTTTADETTTGDSDTTEDDDQSPAQTTTDANTTEQGDDATPTTTPTTTTTTTNQNTIITGTTESEAPGFSYLLGVIALLGSALLVARRT